VILERGIIERDIIEKGIIEEGLIFFKHGASVVSAATAPYIGTAYE
jgi:hypothetical protein